MLEQRIIFAFLVFSLIGLFVQPLSIDAQYNTVIPAWIKNNAGWWASGDIDDASFVLGIQYLIQQGIMNISTPSQPPTTKTCPDGSTIQIIDTCPLPPNKRLTDCNDIRAALDKTAQSNVANGCNLSDADLSDADLSGADLSDAYLYGTDLSDAYLYGTDLSGADLSDANLTFAILSGADLSDANLTFADLSDADLSGAILSGAILSDADLSNAFFQPSGDVNCVGTPINAEFTCTG